MKWAILGLCILASLGLGAFIGYRTALDNQAYYDAPAKIFLYSSLIEQKKTEEYLRGQIIRQIRILNEPELTRYRNELLLQLPPHGSEVVKGYKHYLSQVENKSPYRDALAFLCDQEKDYSGACE